MFWFVQMSHPRRCGSSHVVQWVSGLVIEVVLCVRSSTGVGISIFPTEIDAIMSNYARCRVRAKQLTRQGREMVGLHHHPAESTLERE